MKQWCRYVIGVMAVLVGLIAGPRAARAADEPPVMTARLHLVNGTLAIDPATVQFALGPWADAYRGCQISEAALRQRIIDSTDATLKARGNALEQLALGPRPDNAQLAAAWDAARIAFQGHASTDPLTQKNHNLTADWATAETEFTLWMVHARQLKPIPVQGTSGNVFSRLLQPLLPQALWKGNIAAPPASLKERVKSGTALASTGHFELQPVPPFLADKPGAKLRLEDNVDEWHDDQDSLQAHLVQPFHCELAPQQRIVDGAKTFFDVRGVTMELYRARATDANLAEPPFHAGIDAAEPEFRDAGFGGRVILSPAPAIDALYIQADPKTQGPLVRRVLYLLLPTQDWDRIKAPASTHLCRADNFPQEGSTTVYLDFRDVAGRELDFSKSFLTRAAVAERLRRLADIGYRVALDFPSEQSLARRKGASLVVTPGDKALAAPGELAMRACEHQPVVPDMQASLLEAPEPSAGVTPPAEKTQKRVTEPLHDLRIGVQSDGERKPKLFLSFAWAGLLEEDTFSVLAAQQGRPTGNVEYTHDFIGFDKGLPRRLQVSARAFSEFDPERPTSTAAEDLRRSGVELRLTTDLWRDWVASFAQASLALTQHDTWKEGADGPKERLQKATLGLAAGRTRYGTAASPHFDGGLSFTRGHSRLSGASFCKAEADVAFQRFVGAFNRVDLRAGVAAVSQAAPQSEWPVFGGESSVRGYAAGTAIALRTWNVQSEWWLPVDGLVGRNADLAATLRRSVWLAVLFDVGGMHGAPLYGSGRRTGAGLGLRYSPIGDLTMRLDWARPVGERDARVDRSGNWYLSVTTRRVL